MLGKADNANQYFAYNMWTVLTILIDIFGDFLALIPIL